MNFAGLLALLSNIGPVLEPLLLNLEQNQVQPALQALIAKETSPDLKALLSALDAAIDAFAQLEIKKLG